MVINDSSATNNSNSIIFNQTNSILIEYSSSDTYSLHTEPSHDINDLIVNWDQTDQYNYEINGTVWSTGTSTTFTIPSDNVYLI